MPIQENGNDSTDLQESTIVQAPTVLIEARTEMIPKHRCWHHCLGWLLLLSGSLFAAPHAAIAQLRPLPDDTLGTERSQVTPFNPAIDLINGGARRGANLFHSFREFNVGDDRSVYFTNPAGVANILTRVTGGDLSQILGTLGVLGTANLFLLNPNGILFGANAQLDLRGGSFVASTANSIVFNNSFAFSATNPQALPLLTVNVPVGLQYGSNPGAIQVQGALLEVPDGQTLTLAGGTVNLDGSLLSAPGGRVALVGVATAGVVGLTQQGQEWRLQVPDGLARADVAIANDAFIDVSAGRGGSIAITGRNLTVTGLGTLLVAGIRRGFGTVGAQAGNIDINATETTQLDGSGIINAVLGTGNAGDINITTQVLALKHGAALVANTFRQGSAGNININATDAVFLDGTEPGRTGISTSVASQVSLGAIGQGGNISITTGRLAVTNGARIDATAFGRGNSGSITLVARETVTFDGVGRNGALSAATSVVGLGVTGQGGDIRISTGALSLTNGGQVGTTTFGRGNAGNITIAASDSVSLMGESDEFASGIFSSVNLGAIGRGGNVVINTGTLTLANLGVINAITQGQGNAGDIDVMATTSFSIANGGGIFASTFGQGNAGNISIVANDRVSLEGVGRTGFASTVSSAVNRGAIGAGGDISIATGTLALTNGGQVVASTRGQGNAGKINVVARDSVLLEGTGDRFASGAFSAVTATAVGQGGDITIATGVLSVANGAVVNATTAGRGDAGRIAIVARDAVRFDGVGGNDTVSGAFSTVELGAVGRGGKIAIQTDRFTITNRAALSASAAGEGDAGNLEVNARELRLDRQGSIQAQTASGQGGNITLNIQDLLLLRRGSFISTTAGTAQAGGDGGNITFNGNFIVAVPTENSDISANAFTGSGGRVNITAQGIFGIQVRPQLTPLSDITASSEFGVTGIVSINTPNVDPNRGLIQLPVDLTDASRLIVQTCPTGDSLAKPPNEFVVTGRGGLSPTPSEAVNRDAIQVDLVTASREPVPSEVRSPLPPVLVTEAQTIQVEANGTVALVALVPQSRSPVFDRLIHCR